MLTDEQQREWDEWVAARPDAVREVASKFPPWHIYRLVTTGQLATVDQYDEANDDGSVTVSVTVWQEWLPIPHGVFGVNPNDLEIEEEFGALRKG